MIQLFMHYLFLDGFVKIEWDKNNLIKIEKGQVCFNTSTLKKYKIFDQGNWLEHGIKFLFY